MADSTSVLGRIGIEAELVDSGCCGLAGAFGYERGHYAVSVGCGERVLLSAVRTAPPEMLIVTDGYSCREQILQLTGRDALHIAEVLQQTFATVDPSKLMKGG